MFSLTSKSQYAIEALFEIIKIGNGSPVSTVDIIKSTNIPKHFLNQIFSSLTRFGIVKSVRGQKGGYYISADPKELTLLNILEALEGKIDMSKSKIGVITDKIFIDLENEIRKVLDISLIKLLKRVDNSEQLMFYI